MGDRFGLPAALLLLVTGIVAAAPEEVRLEGSFLWERGDEKIEGELTSVRLTPSGEGTWEIAFRFDWEGEPHVFSGTAEGSLSGELAGNVASDDPGHPLKFEFRGAFADGQFSGTHGYWNAKGDLIPSGTLTLAPIG